jgi:hypothetical protein
MPAQSNGGHTAHVASTQPTSFRRRARIARQVLARPGERGLMLRMLVWRLLVSTLKHVVPIRRLVTIAGGATPARAAAGGFPPQARIIELARLACRPRLIRSRDNCLDRSLIAYRYLRAVGATPSLVIGFGRDAGGVRGHAWLTIDGQEVGEPHTTHADFKELLRFAADGSMVTAEAD